jgi:hypothetical protein
MLFPRRRWAVRLIEKMGLPIKSREATILVDFVIRASKQNEQMIKRSTEKSLPTAELVLLAASRMASNQSAVMQLAKELAVNVVAAHNVLIKLSKAAHDVASENGYTKPADTIDRSHPTP